MSPAGDGRYCAQDGPAEPPRWRWPHQASSHLTAAQTRGRQDHYVSFASRFPVPAPPSLVPVLPEAGPRHRARSPSHPPSEGAGPERRVRRSSRAVARGSALASKNIPKLLPDAAHIAQG